MNFARPQLHVPSRRPLVALVAALAVLSLLLIPLAVPAEAQGPLQGLGGERLAEADLARGTTIIVVWASWSPRGKDIAGRVNQIASRWGSDARVVTVNFQEDRATVEEFLQGKNLRAPVFLDTDGSFSKKNAVTNLPGLLVVKDGSTAFRGKLPDDPDAVISQILG